MEDGDESERQEARASCCCQDSTDPTLSNSVAKTLVKSGILSAVLLLLLLLLLVHVSVGLRMQRVPHPDEVWTINKLLASSGQLIWVTVLKNDNHPPCITCCPRVGSN